METDLRDPGNAAQHEILDARLGGRGHRDGVAIAAEAGRDPEDVDLGDAIGVILSPTSEWGARHTFHPG